MNYNDLKEIILKNEELFLSEKEFKLKCNLSDLENCLTDPNTFIQWFVNTGARIYPSVYKDIEQIQCNSAKYRSTGDIFIMTHHYFPEVTLEEVICILVKLHLEEEIKTIHCRNINKRVWIYLDCSIDEFEYENKKECITKTNNLSYSDLKFIYEYNNKEVLAEQE